MIKRINEEPFENYRDRKDMCFLVSYIPKDGREFESYRKMPSGFSRLNSGTVLYDLRKKVYECGTNFFNWEMEEQEDSWQVIVRVKKGTKIYNRFIELGFGEI